MTIDGAKFRERVTAARARVEAKAVAAEARGDTGAAREYRAQATGMTVAMATFTLGEMDAARERDEELARNIEDERLGELALDLGIIGGGA